MSHLGHSGRRPARPSELRHGLADALVGHGEPGAELLGEQADPQFLQHPADLPGRLLVAAGRVQPAERLLVLLPQHVDLVCEHPVASRVLGELVEPDLQRGWISAASKGHGDWNSVRGYAQDAYERSASTLDRQSLRDKANIAAEEADKRLDTENDLDLL